MSPSDSEHPKSAAEPASGRAPAARVAGEPTRGEAPPGSAPPADEPVQLHVRRGSSAARLNGNWGTVGEATVITARPPFPATANPAVPTASELGTLLEGEQLEHFQIEKYVGGGGMGAVFRARDTRLERTVALKVLSPSSAADEETLRRFLNEAQSAARLDHEYVARVYYSGQDKGLHFIVFEFIEGMNLRDMVERDGPLSVSDAVRFTWQLAQALDHASSRDVVHRDIKPSNVLVAARGRVKLVDMGLARVHQVERTDDLTASGVTLGTFDYISPEQARDPRAVDVRSDIYSLGCTLYFMLTARPPFPEGTVLQKLLQHQGDAPPDPRDARPDLPAPLAQVLAKMLAKDPRERYQSPSALLGDLELVAAELGWSFGEGSTRAAPSAGQVASRLWSRNLPWLAAVGALAVVVMALDLSARWSPMTSLATRVPPPDFEPGASSARQALVAEPGAGGASAGNLPAPREASGERRPNGAPSTLPPPPSGASTGAEALTPNGAAVSRGGASGPERDLPEGAAAPTNVAESAATVPAQAPAPPDSAPPPPGTIGLSPDDALPRPVGEFLAADVELGWPRADVSATLAAAAGLSAADLSAPTSPRSPGAERTAAPVAPVDVPPAGRSTEESAVTPSGVLVVRDNPVGPGQFASLKAACAAAQTGDVIELRFNGPRTEAPFEIRQRGLTLRAAVGYRPLVRFRPELGDPVVRPRAMIRLADARISVTGVDWQWELPTEAGPAGGWSLFVLEQGAGLRLEESWLTVANGTTIGAGFHPDVAWLRLAGEADEARVGEDATLEEAAHVRLDDCVVRGEAALLDVAAGRGLNLTWNNGLLVAGGGLLDLDVAGGAAQESELSLELDHLTIWVRDCLVRVREPSEGARLLRVQIDAADSLVLGGATAAVIDELGVDPARSAQEGIRWQGQRNFFEGFAAFWRVRGAEGSEPLRVTRWSDWRAFWRGGREQWGNVAWAGPRRTTPVSDWAPTDFLLAEGSSAREAASDGGDVGLSTVDLPPVNPAIASFPSPVDPSGASLPPESSEAGPAATETP